jgi:hypothetical protein
VHELGLPFHHVHHVERGVLDVLRRVLEVLVQVGPKAVPQERRGEHVRQRQLAAGDPVPYQLADHAVAGSQHIP